MKAFSKIIFNHKNKEDNMKKTNVKLLILADDLTGALDSGVQLTRKGDKVIIRTDLDRALAHLRTLMCW